jgi:NAD(P)-dependent dehydrogenase (short-subunit alcohol dehydrogenase family)
MSLSGRYAIITGASQGLGEAIAEKFVIEGASIFLCARSLSKLEALKARLEPGLAKDQKIVTTRADVSRCAEVDAMVAKALEVFPHIDALINNAGVYGPMGELDEIDWQEWVDAVTVNLMGTVYPCRAMLPHFRTRQYGKIINLSGGGATNPLPRISSYAASKAAVVRFTETLALELDASHVDVNAVAPGALATQMMDKVIAAGPEKVGKDFHARMIKLHAEGGTPLSKGADLCAYLASSQSDGISGKLISAVWDPWTDLQKHAIDLKGSDIYTLRRIVPADRGKEWGQ